MQSSSSAAVSGRLIDVLMPGPAAGAVRPHDVPAPHMLWAPFVEVARAHPQRPAVLASGASVTYGALLQSALRVARSLMDAAVDQSAPVAVFMDKGWEQVATVLGVQLAGAAYLPIPIDWPSLRVASLIGATGARVAVVGTADDARRLPSGLVTYECSRCGPAARLEEAIDRDDPTQLAYIIPTSGTTGTPKAVMIEHGAAWNTIRAINDAFGVGAHDRILALSALHFDLSVYDIFGMLAVGGAIVLPDASHLRDPEHWIDLCRRSQVTMWSSVPALARMLVESGTTPDEALTRCASLRLMMLSGDWIPLKLAAQVRQQRPDLRLVSLGGATEASIWSIVFPIEDIDPSWKSVPYGQALPGQSIAVLDDALERLPPWVDGEIYIGGTGLARGYWRDDQMTRERFVTHPRTGERLYRTGDVGRVWPDGTVELLGRIDSQVKISGHRVELAEIEAHLQSCPGVRSALVAYRPVGTLQRKELVGYIVPAAEALKPPPGPLSGPVERLRFKLQEPGVRRFPDTVRAIPFEPPRDGALASAVRARRTHRSFSASPLSREALHALLAHVMQLALNEFPLPKYLYPSAGSLYPVQVYLHVCTGRIAGLEGGTYYCDPRGTGLYPLTVGGQLAPSSFGHVNLHTAEQAAFSIFLVGELAAIAPMYPEQARDFCLLEAGCITQALMTAAPGAGIGLCPIGGVEGDAWRTLLKLGDTQIFLHALLGGVCVQDAHAGGGAHDTTAVVDRTPLPQAAGAMARREIEAHAVRELRERLGSRLPSYMIPSAWVVLDALPLTANGKIDRNNLPEPVVASTDGALDQPATDTEAKVYAVWRRLLGDKAIAMDQSFFDAGGDSLLLLTLRSELAHEFAVTVSLVDLFEHPSIRSVARLLGGASTPPVDRSRVIDAHH